MERIASVCWDVDQAIPYSSVACETTRVRVKILRLAIEDCAFGLKVGELGPISGIDLPGEAGQRWARRIQCVLPTGYSDNTLTGPVLSRRAVIPLLILDMKQNPKAASSILPVELGALCIGEAMSYPAAIGFSSIAKQPVEVGPWRSDCGEGDGFSRREDRGIECKGGNRVVAWSKVRRLRAIGNHKRQVGVDGSAGLAVLHIVKTHVRHLPSQA